ncbi:MAG: AzlD domain-containing protein [Clostridia bacterium]|nr:AzlD domain-containing protein [Clostridia bacterium]
MSIAVYILTMALVTYLIRAVPFAVFRQKIRSRFVRSFLSYIPYAVLTAMTVPAIFYATGDPITAAVGTAVALVLAYANCPLILVALAAATGALLTGMIL